MIRTLIITALALVGVAHFASNTSIPGSSLFAAPAHGDTTFTAAAR